MDLNTITVTDFKNLFVRDFPYLPIWSNTTTYNTGAIVYYTNGLFYQCLSNGVTAIPTNVTYWVLYTADIYDYVLDADIQRAFDEAKMTFNQGLISDGTTASITMAFLYVSAHYLVNDIRTSKASLSGDGFNPVQSRTVGSVTESYMIPDRYKRSPIIIFYSKSGYGQKYLAMILPAMVGNIQVAAGWTTP